MSDRFDGRTIATAALHAELRAVLKAHFARAPMHELATALTYEAASIAATLASSEAQACDVLAGLHRAQIAQVHAFGVGAPHP
jgi:hypothetical protein